MVVFDLINIINEKKDFDLEEVETIYKPWIVNKTLSFHQQTVLFANMMNIYYNLDEDMQFSFYFYGIPKGKRYGKWQNKAKLVDDVEMLTQYYSINKQLAMSYLSLHNEEQLKHIRESFEKGGKHGKSSRGAGGS
jgi:hypothetical protein